jgi:hypothetical protein
MPILSSLFPSGGSTVVNNYGDDDYLAIQALQEEVDTVEIVKRDVADSYSKSEVYNKTEVDNLVGVNEYNGYTILQTDALLDLKRNIADSYTIANVDSLLSAKSNVADVYLKSTVDTLLSAKINTSSKGAVSGVCGLDANSKISVGNLPTYTISFNSRSGAVVPIETDYSQFYHTKDEISTNHYTKTVSDNRFQRLEDMINYQPAGDMSNYYTKSQIDTNNYTKTQIDTNIYTKSQIDANNYTKTQTDSLLSAKANQSTTYTKTEIDTNHYTKTQIDANNYTKTQTDSLLSAKANQSTTYTKTEIDANNYTKTQIDANNYTKTQADSLLSAKANQSTTYTKTEIDTNHYTKTQIDTNTYTKTQANDLLNAKVNTSLIGANNGIAPLDGSGKIASSYLNAVGVTSFNTRTGAVVPTAGDYDSFYYTKSLADGKYQLISNMINYLPVNNFTATGTSTLNNAVMTNGSVITAPTSANHIANKSYVDSAISTVSSNFTYPNFSIASYNLGNFRIEYKYDDLYSYNYDVTYTNNPTNQWSNIIFPTNVKIPKTLIDSSTGVPSSFAPQKSMFFAFELTDNAGAPKSYFNIAGGFAFNLPEICNDATSRFVSDPAYFTAGYRTTTSQSVCVRQSTTAVHLGSNYSATTGKGTVYNNTWSTPVEYITNNRIVVFLHVFRYSGNFSSNFAVSLVHCDVTAGVTKSLGQIFLNTDYPITTLTPFIIMNTTAGYSKLKVYHTLPSDLQPFVVPYPGYSYGSDSENSINIFAK